MPPKVMHYKTRFEAASNRLLGMRVHLFWLDCSNLLKDDGTRENNGISRSLVSLGRPSWSCLFYFPNHYFSKKLIIINELDLHSTGFSFPDLKPPLKTDCLYHSFDDISLSLDNRKEQRNDNHNSWSRKFRLCKCFYSS